MSLIVYINTIITIIALITSYWYNRDLFSPVKFYLFSAITYFYDSFVNPYSYFILFSYLFFVIIALIIVPYERIYTTKFYRQVSIFRKHKKSRNISQSSSNRILFNIIALTTIPIAAQIYHIYLMGGIQAYLLSIPLRIQLWAGLGYVIHFKTILPIVNLFFFIFFCTFNIKNKKLWLTILIIHTLITVIIGFLTGSRSATLLNFLYFIITYHYLISYIKIHYIAISVVILLPLSSLLGYFREASFLTQLSENEVELSNDIIDSKLSDHNTVSQKIAIFPLEILEQKHYDDLCFGSTYLSALTNFVPKILWTNKLSSGGTIITNFGLGNTSNEPLTSAYSTGAIAEGIINFGYYIGYIAAGIHIGLFFYIIFKSFSFTYKNLQIFFEKKNLKNLKKIIWGIFLIISTIQLPASSIGGEFTNAIFNIILRLLLAYIVFKSLFYRVSLYENRY